MFFIHNTTHFPNIQNVYAILFVAIIIILGKGIWRDLIFALKFKKPRIKSIYLGAFQDKKATDGSGLFAFLIGASNQTSSSSYNLTNGRAIRMTCNNKLESNAGARSYFTVTKREFNPYFKMIFSLVQTTNQRFWIGLTDNMNADPTGDTEMNGKNCFCLGARSTDTHFMIVRNNGSDSASWFKVDPITKIDTAVHTIEIWADETNKRFLYRFDNKGKETRYYIEDVIPSNISQLGPLFQIETTVAESKSIDIFSGEIESDR